MGIALSYSIHILCHANHCHDPRQIIRDLAYPLTIGSITTIGAFAGLLFTDSQLLRDFGLFASLTLVGTTLFSLVLLPHLIRKEKRGGGSAVLERVERLTGMRPDRNRPLVAAILLLTFICLFFFNRIGFDSDMMHLNYDPPRLAGRAAAAEQADRRRRRTVEGALHYHGRHAGRSRRELPAHGPAARLAQTGRENRLPRRHRIVRGGQRRTAAAAGAVAPVLDSAAAGSGARGDSRGGKTLRFRRRRGSTAH